MNGAVRGAAWSFGAGAHTVSAQATDRAGNVGSASTTFTVTVRPADLSKLTTQLVTGPAKYQSANLTTKVAVALAVTTATNASLDLTRSVAGGEGTTSRGSWLPWSPLAI